MRNKPPTVIHFPVSFRVSQIFPRFAMRIAGSSKAPAVGCSAGGRTFRRRPRASAGRRSSSRGFPTPLSRSNRMARRDRISTRLRRVARRWSDSWGFHSPNLTMRTATACGATISATRTQKLSFKTRISPRATSRPLTRISTGHRPVCSRGRPTLLSIARLLRSGVRCGPIRSANPVRRPEARLGPSRRPIGRPKTRTS